DPALWPKLTPQIRDAIVSQGPANIESSVEFPLDEHNRHFSTKFQDRHLENGEVLKRRWLCYSKYSNRAFCLCCKLYDVNPKSSLATAISNDWRHMSQILISHEKSPRHFLSYQTWTEASLRLRRGECIDKEHKLMTTQERERWKSVLERLIQIALFLSKQLFAAPLIGFSQKTMKTFWD
ncbi:unnamed protein product, partial [Ixodes pacificus]